MKVINEINDREVQITDDYHYQLIRNQVKAAREKWLTKTQQSTKIKSLSGSRFII